MWLLPARISAGISSGIQLPLTGFSLSLWAPVLSFLLQLSQLSDQLWVLRREDGQPPVGMPSGRPGKSSGPQEGRKDMQCGSQPTPGPLLFFLLEVQPHVYRCGDGGSDGGSTEIRNLGLRRFSLWGASHLGPGC